MGVDCRWMLHCVDVDDYKSEQTARLSNTWKRTKEQVKKAQTAQERCYDCCAKGPSFLVGDQVFIYMPAAKQVKAHKLAWAFHRLYHVLELTSNNLQVVPVHKPQAASIFVVVMEAPMDVLAIIWGKLGQELVLHTFNHYLSFSITAVSNKNVCIT